MEEVKCGMDGCESNRPGLEACVPIAIPKGDPDFADTKCIKFVRTQEVPDLNCGYGKLHKHTLLYLSNSSYILYS